MMRASLLFVGGVIVLVGVATVLGFSGVKEYKRASAIDREIAALSQEVDRLERTNADLEERISYFSSDAYKERVAKERLGFRREGEQVVVIAQGADDVDPEVQREEKVREMFPESQEQGWLERLWTAFVK